MFNKALTGFAAAATVAGSLAAMAPAQAAGLTNSVPFTWDNLKKHEVKSGSTDTSGFQSLIPEFQKYVQKETLAISPDKQKAQKLNVEDLVMKFDHNIRVWFVNEGAWYVNQLGYQTVKDGKETGKGEIFNQVSCTTGCQLGEGANGALNIGDYVDIGTVSAGTQLNFLLRQNGYKDGTTVFGGAYPDQNVDKLQHLVAYAVGDYLLMGFEDLTGGGDKDFNDVVFVVDFGKGNITQVPEPGTMAALLGVTGAGMWLRRRKKQASA